MLCRCLLAAIFFLAVSMGSSAARAHFLWLQTDADSPSDKVRVFFSETAEPDDPALLDGIKPEVWLLDRRSKPQAVELKRAGDCLEGVLPEERPAALILRCTYGVTTRQKDTFLLKYYAKTYPSVLPGAWRAVADKDRLPLEIVPQMAADGLSLKVTWQGEPVAGAAVVVAGPGLETNWEGATDSNGSCHVKLTSPGVFSIRARHIESVEGEHEGQPYQAVRHYSTLTLPYAPARLAPTATALPDMPRGVTSFGAAVSGDTVYVYGGNYGDAHDFTNEGQSGDLMKLDLRHPAKWETVAGSSKLQGLAMVEHDGRLYRVGGFTARNKAGEEQDLVSQPDFARLSASQDRWEPLADLPEGRSSHDAAVIGDTLYVVGGWRLPGKGKEPVWHDTALAACLTDKDIDWRTIAPPPFKRRALTLAAWRGKLYVIGGMREEGGPTTAVTVFDPKSGAWSEGPSLLGENMEGFGASAMAGGDALYVTTMSGSIQRLSDDAEGWQYVGQLAQPRFFHRLLSWKQDRLLVVGGASMSVGKIAEVELLELPK